MLAIVVVCCAAMVGEGLMCGLLMLQEALFF